MFFDDAEPQPDAWLEVFINYWNSEGTWSSLPEKTKNIWRRQFHKVYAEVKHLCLDRTPLSFWKSIHHPTWITISQHSPKHEKEVCQLLVQTLPAARLVEHKGGHLSPVTHFSELAPIVKQWSRDPTVVLN